MMFRTHELFVMVSQFERKGRSLVAFEFDRPLLGESKITLGCLGRWLKGTAYGVTAETYSWERKKMPEKISAEVSVCRT